MSMSSIPSHSPSGKLYGWVERIGNKVPHPFLLFIYLIVILMVATAVLSAFDVSVRSPADGRPDHLVVADRDHRVVLGAGGDDLCHRVGGGVTSRVRVLPQSDDPLQIFLVEVAHMGAIYCVHRVTACTLG